MKDLEAKSSSLKFIKFNSLNSAQNDFRSFFNIQKKKKKFN